MSGAVGAIAPPSELVRLQRLVNMRRSALSIAEYDLGIVARRAAWTPTRRTERSIQKCIEVIPFHKACVTEARELLAAAEADLAEMENAL